MEYLGFKKHIKRRKKVSRMIHTQVADTIETAHEVFVEEADEVDLVLLSNRSSPQSRFFCDSDAKAMYEDIRKDLRSHEVRDVELNQRLTSLHMLISDMSRQLHELSVFCGIFEG